jgi:hypothetical protein
MVLLKMKRLLMLGLINIFSETSPKSLSADRQALQRRGPKLFETLKNPEEML